VALEVEFDPRALVAMKRRGPMVRTSRWTRGYIAVGFIGLLVGAVLAAGCSSGTSNADKTATAVAKNASATVAPTKPLATATAAKATSPTALAATTTTTTASGTSTPSAATSTVKIAQSASLGNILTDANGMTLYTYKDDVPNSGVSSVPAGIAPNWPPLTISSGAPVAPTGLPGKLSAFTLPDGSKQVEYLGMPLYLFVGDKKAGDTTGQGLINKWYVAPP
jgi:predicted lipoprotein with Yx(FWY)xxD motif